MGAWNTWVTGLSGKVGWYKLDETSGTSATDSSGAGHTGTYTGTIGFSGASLIPSESASKSVNMDASGDNMQAIGALYTTRAGTLIATMKSGVDQTGRMFQGAGAPATYLRIDNNQSKAIFAGNVYDLGYDPTALFDNVARLVMYILRTTSVELWVGTVAGGFSMVGTCSHAEASVVDGYTFLKGASQGILADFDDFVIVDRAISSVEAAAGFAAWVGSTDATVSPPAATATVEAPVPSVSLDIASPVATATVEAPVPVLSSDILPPAALVTAEAPAPTIGDSDSVLPPAAIAVVEAPVPTIYHIAPLTSDPWIVEGGRAK